MLHGGWVHLLMNMVSLYFVGRVLEQGIGRPAYLFFLLITAEAGMAASLFGNPDGVWRMGISGGIAGLVGVVLALEWAITDSWREFWQQRNTRLVMFLLVVNVGLAFWMGTIQGAKIDHSGHLGGLVVGLLGGLAFYTRRGTQATRGVVVALAMVVPPIAYAGHPIFNVHYHWFRFDSAKDSAEREVALRGVLSVEPDNLRARVRLAINIDQPGPLEGIATQESSILANRIVTAWLLLASRRLETNPDEAIAFAARAAEIENSIHPGWLEFGKAAETAGLTELSEQSYVRAYAALKVLRRAGRLWRPAWARLLMMSQQELDLADPVVFEQWIGLASEASGGLRTNNPQLIQTLEGVRRSAEAMAVKQGGAPEFARPLSDFYGRLASGSNEMHPRVADYDVMMAIWWWRGAEDQADPETLELASGRFGTAWQSAVRTRNFYREAQAEAWFRQHAIPLPEPELAEPEESGPELADDEDGG